MLVNEQNSMVPSTPKRKRVFKTKMCFGSVGISLASSNVESLALFRYKIVLVPDFAWFIYGMGMDYI